MTGLEMIIILLLLFVLSFILFNAIYKRTKYFRNQHLDLESYRKGVPSEIDIAVFGSTYSLYGFQALHKFYGDRCFNFSLNAESIAQDALLFRQYKKHFSIGGIVIFTLAPCVCYYAYEQSPQYNSYFLLARREIPNFVFWESLKFKYPLLENLKQLFYSFKYSLSSQNGIQTLDDCFPQSVSQQVAADNMRVMAEGWINLFHLKNLKDKNENEENEKNLYENVVHLREMINDCLSHHIQPVIVIPPFSATLNQFFGEAFLKHGMYRLIQKAVGEENVLIFNYLEDVDFQENSSLFTDGGFRLNQAGSTLLCKKVIRELRKIEP